MAAIALAVVAGLYCYQSFIIGDLQSRLDLLGAKLDKLTPAFSRLAPEPSPSAPSSRTNRTRPHTLAVQQALPPWLIERKREEMFLEMIIWENNGKLNSRIVEMAGLSEFQALRLEELNRSGKESRKKVAVLPPEILESSPQKIVVQMEKEDQALIQQLYQEHLQAVDAVLGADFDPLIRSKLVPDKKDAEITTLTIEKSDDQNVIVRHEHRSVDGAVFAASRSEPAVIPRLDDKEKLVLRQLGISVD